MYSVFAMNTILFRNVQKYMLFAGREVRVNKNWAKFPHSPILHYACGSMYAVLCFTTKKQQKQRIVPQLLHCFSHYFPLTITCMHNEVMGLCGNLAKNCAVALASGLKAQFFSIQTHQGRQITCYFFFVLLKGLTC